jgi:hypothetical protein
MKTIELSKFKGIRNDVSPERFDKEDLQAATNIELDETGKPYRRLGATELDAVASHSLWANDELAYVVRGGTLRQIMPDLTITDLGITISGPRVAYSRVGNDVFFSDNLIKGVVGTNGYRPWGIAPPIPAYSKGVGDLRAGTYLVTTTYLRTNGLESGASPVVSVPCTGAESIVVTMPASADPLAGGWQVYVSDTNGEVPYLIATMLASDTTATISALPAARTLAVRTLRCGPPPAGQVVGNYKGRTYVADGAYLWYSLPYEYELFHKAMNFLPFSAPVKTFNAVADGIYIGTEDATVFLHGDDPATFVQKPAAPYGTVLGTESLIPAYYFGKGDNPTPVQLWMSKQGLCAGLEGGHFMNLTGGRYVLPEGVAKGASLLKLRGASPQLVTTLFS